MATHHGRPGGRLVEVVLALTLAALSAATLCAVAVGAVYLLAPIGRGGGPLVVGILALAFWVLKYPWNALLRYYRYEAHTLRPIKDEKTAVPGNGSDKNEG